MDVEAPGIAQRYVESSGSISESVAGLHPHAVDQGDQDAVVAQIPVEIAVEAARDVEFDADVGDVMVGNGANGAGIGPAGGVAIGNDAAVSKAAVKSVAVNA